MIELLGKYRSSYHRCSIKEGVLKMFAKFTGKHLSQSLFFNKAAGLRTEHIQATRIVLKIINTFQYRGRSRLYHLYRMHWVKIFQLRSFSCIYFPTCGLNTEIYGVNLCIYSKYGKIRFWALNTQLFMLFK